MIPLLYQLSYAGWTLILAMQPGLSNPAQHQPSTRTKDEATRTKD